MKVIGITGGIGSGKSYILAELARRGYPTYEADKRAKALLEEDLTLRQEVIALFGAEAYAPQGRLNRSYIAARLFADPSLKEALEALVHPRTMLDFQSWVARCTGAPAVFKEAALTIEAKAWEGLSALAVVYAPLPLRLSRLLQRGDLTLEEGMTRLKAQLPDWHKLSYADYVFLNTEGASAEVLVTAFLQAFGLPLQWH